MAWDHICRCGIDRRGKSTRHSQTGAKTKQPSTDTHAYRRTVVMVEAMVMMMEAMPVPCRGWRSRSR